jgi:carbamoylphosphate synthase small subunit
MFTGGADVSPALYGEDTLRGTIVSMERDREDVSTYERLSARKDKKRGFVGICRGGQLLNVLNGGRLWQHVEGHCRDHPVLDIETGKVFRCSSTHHQQFRLPAPEQAIPHKVLALALERDGTNTRVKTNKFTASTTDTAHDGQDLEAVYYPNTNSLCFQPHPEYHGYPECGELFLKYVTEHVLTITKQETT